MKIDSAGRISIPAKGMEDLGWHTGQCVEFWWCDEERTLCIFLEGEGEYNMGITAKIDSKNRIYCKSVFKRLGMSDKDIEKATLNIYRDWIAIDFQPQNDNRILELLKILYEEGDINIFGDEDKVIITLQVTIELR